MRCAEHYGLPEPSRCISNIINLDIYSESIKTIIVSRCSHPSRCFWLPFWKCKTLTKFDLSLSVLFLKFKEQSGGRSLSVMELSVGGRVGSGGGSQILFIHPAPGCNEEGENKVEK